MDIYFIFFSYALFFSHLLQLLPDFISFLRDVWLLSLFSLCLFIFFFLLFYVDDYSKYNLIYTTCHTESILVID